VIESIVVLLFGRSVGVRLQSICAHATGSVHGHGPAVCSPPNQVHDEDVLG
jgi:hypothetical protein